MASVFTSIMFGLLLAACTNQSSKSSNESSGGSAPGSSGGAVPGTVLISGQLAAENVPAGDKSVDLARRDVQVVDATGNVTATAPTDSNGKFTVAVPGTIALGSGTSSGLLDASSNLALQSIISDTPDQSVIGTKSMLDFTAARTTGALSLGKTQLAKITAIRGNAVMDGVQDNTGISVYIPGTSYSARTDAAGNFLMTFMPAGTYALRFEKNGFTSVDVASLIVKDSETSKVDSVKMHITGGASLFAVKQIGSEGLSQSRTVTFLITGGNSDRFKGGTPDSVATAAFGPVPAQFSYTFPSDGVQTIRMVFGTADGFQSTIDRVITVLTTPPSAASLSLADRSSLRTAYTKERYVVGYQANCSSIDKIAVLPSSATAPQSGDFLWSCFSTATASTFLYQIPSGTTVFSYKIWAKDAVGNISTDYASGTITLIPTPPTAPSFTLSKQTTGSLRGTDITTANLSVASCTGIDKILFSESQTTQPAASAFSTTCSATANAFTYTFANNIEGTKTVFLWAMDNAGNVGPVSSSASIVLSYTKPTSPSFTLADPVPVNSGYVRSVTTTATIANCSNVDQVLISESQATKPTETDPRWVPCATTGVAITTPSSDGSHTFNLWAKNIGGIVADTATQASITVLKTPPTAPSFNLINTVNGGSTMTASTLINAAINTCNPVTAYRVALTATNTAPSSNAMTTACATSGLTFTLPSSSDGVQSAYLWVMDLAGNISQSAATASITLKTTLPSLPTTFAISGPTNASTTYTNSLTPNFQISSCPAGVDAIYLNEGQTTAPAPVITGPAGWISCPVTTGSMNVSLSSSQGSKSVKLWVRDAAGNLNGPMSPTPSSIILDTVPPNSPSVNALASATSSGTITVGGSVNEANSNVNVTGASTSYNFTANGSGSFSGAIVLNANSGNSLQFMATDPAGNNSNVTYAYITHDSIAPTISGVSIFLTHNSAVITWNTDEAATSVVNYSTDFSYGTIASDANLSWGHSITLTGLSPDTVYHYQLQSLDQAGNASTVTTGSFNTFIAKSGNITSNTTWSRTDVPYYITGNITVNAGVKLTIAPGVTVKFKTGLGIWVSGTLSAIGTSGSPITFTSAAQYPNAGDWGMIYFDGPSSNAAVTFSGSDCATTANCLEWATIQYGGSGSAPAAMIKASQAQFALVHATVSNSAGIAVQSDGGSTTTTGASAVYVRNSTISNSQLGLAVYDSTPCSSGIKCDTYVEVANSTITNISSGLDNGYYGNGIYISDATRKLASPGILITGNTISNNVGAYWSAAGGGALIRSSWSPEPVYVTFTSNAVTANGSSGLQTSNVNGQFDQNYFANNTTGNYASAASINTAGAPPVSVQKNVFCDNKCALYLATTQSSGTITVASNSFCRNITDSNGNMHQASTIVAHSGANGGEADTFTINYNNNTFSANQGTEALWISSAAASTYTFSHNNFLNNLIPSTYTIYNTRGSGSTAVNAQNNYFSIPNGYAINDMVYDHSNNLSYGTVDTSNILANPDTTAPMSPPTGLSVTGLSSGSVRLTWTANPETTINGYRIYYNQSGSGYPFTGTGATQGASGGITTGNVTTFDLTGLTPGQYYTFAVTARRTGTVAATDIVNGIESWYSPTASITSP